MSFESVIDRNDTSRIAIESSIQEPAERFSLVDQPINCAAKVIFLNPYSSSKRTESLDVNRCYYDTEKECWSLVFFPKENQNAFFSITSSKIIVLVNDDKIKFQNFIPLQRSANETFCSLDTRLRGHFEKLSSADISHFFQEALKASTPCETINFSMKNSLKSRTIDLQNANRKIGKLTYLLLNLYQI